MTKAEKAFKQRLFNLLQADEVESHKCQLHPGDSDNARMADAYFGRIDALREVIALTDTYFGE